MEHLEWIYHLIVMWNRSFFSGFFFFRWNMKVMVGSGGVACVCGGGGWAGTRAPCRQPPWQRLCRTLPLPTSAITTPLYYDFSFQPHTSNEYPVANKKKICRWSNFLRQTGAEFLRPSSQALHCHRRNVVWKSKLSHDVKVLPQLF